MIPLSTLCGVVLAAAGHTVQEAPAIVGDFSSEQGWSLALVWSDGAGVASGGWSDGGLETYVDLVLWSQLSVPPQPGSYAEGVRRCAEALNLACPNDRGCWFVYRHPSVRSPVASCKVQCQDRSGNCPPMPADAG